MFGDFSAALWLLFTVEWVNNCWWGWQNRTDLGKCTHHCDKTQGNNSTRALSTIFFFFLHPKKTTFVKRAGVLLFPCFLSQRWVHFPRSLLCCLQYPVLCPVITIFNNWYLPQLLSVALSMFFWWQPWSTSTVLTRSIYILFGRLRCPCFCGIYHDHSNFLLLFFSVVVHMLLWYLLWSSPTLLWSHFCVLYYPRFLNTLIILSWWLC